MTTNAVVNWERSVHCMYVHVHAWCVCACMVCMCMHSSACTSVVCVFVHNCRVGSETNNHAGSNPGFVCNTYRNVTTAAHVHDHEVELDGGGD